MKAKILPRRWLAKLAMAFVALAVIAAAGTIYAYPAVAAVACPTCYGLDWLDSNVFVDRNMPAGDRAHVIDILSEARKRVATFYEDFTSTPRTLVCSTEDCYQHIGGHRERGKSFFDFALMLSPRGLSVTIASHELSHIELHHRVGFIRSLTNAIPAWFDEGVAVIVADDRRYLAPVAAPDRCLVRSDKSLPNTMSEWNRVAGEQDSHIYAEAACRVSDWMSHEGGSYAVRNLVQTVSTGTPFSRIHPQ
jgi:hypothetical protein